MARLHTGEDLASRAGENLVLLFVGELFELGTSEASLGEVGVLGDDLELLGDSDSGLFGITSDHDDVDAGGLALLDGASDLGSGRISDANISEERAVAFVVLILLVVSKFLRSVGTSDFLHVSTIKSDSDTKDT